MQLSKAARLGETCLPKRYDDGDHSPLIQFICLASPALFRLPATGRDVLEGFALACAGWSDPKQSQNNHYF